MAQVINQDLKYDRLSLIPLGGQSELGQVLWVIAYGGKLLLVDAGATYAGDDLPGVDLLLPNTNFLEANQSRIQALLLTNGHEEHSGAVSYLLNHMKIPRIMGPRFVSTLVGQALQSKGYDTICDTVQVRHPYRIGPFEVEWIQVNDAIADACALRIGTPEGNIIYTSSFKLDQTPVDGKLLDMARLAQAGSAEVLLLISDSAGVESQGYAASEKKVIGALEQSIASAPARVVVVTPGTNTHRLQILFDLAKKLNRKVILCGETLIQTAVVAVITGNLQYDRKIEASMDDLSSLPDEQILFIATGQEGDPLKMLSDLAWKKSRDIVLKAGDTVIYSAEVYPGRSRQMAMILDQFLAFGVKAVNGIKDGVHVSNHASREELKLMLSVTKPKLFVPALGEGRHIVNHGRLAMEWGMEPENVFPLANGDILEIYRGQAAVCGAIEAQAVLYNRDQLERVTSFSVKERKSLSGEGVLTIGLALDGKGQLLAGPSLEAFGSGYLRSPEWLMVEKEIKKQIADLLKSFQEKNAADLNELRSQVREGAAKLLRAKLQAKPLVQVVIHEVSTSHRQ